MFLRGWGRVDGGSRSQKSHRRDDIANLSEIVKFSAKCIHCGVSYNPVDCQGLMKEVIICIDARDTKAWSRSRSGGENDRETCKGEKISHDHA